MIDLSSSIKLGHQVGYNAFYYKCNKDEHLVIPNKLITSKIINLIVGDKYTIIHTHNNVYKVPSGLSTYRISPDELDYEKYRINKL